MQRAPFPDDLSDLDQLLEALPDDADVGQLPPANELAACARYLASRHRLNSSYARKVGHATGLPIVTLPRLAAGIRGPDDLETLSEPLLARPSRPTQA